MKEAERLNEENQRLLRERQEREGAIKELRKKLLTAEKEGSRLSIEDIMDVDGRENEKRLLDTDLVIQKRKKVKDLPSDNEYLKTVIADHENLKQSYAREKQEQFQAFQELYDYIATLAREGSLSKQNVIDAKAEQDKILQQMNQIEKELDTTLPSEHK
jgi:hypothetical protein